MLFGNLFGEQSNQLAYSEFLVAVDDGTVSAVTIDPEGRVTGELEDGSEFTTVIPTALDQAELTLRSGLGDESLEYVGIELVRRDFEHVSTGVTIDAFSQRLPQDGDVCVQGAGATFGQVSIPHCVQQGVL